MLEQLILRVKPAQIELSKVLIRSKPASSAHYNNIYLYGYFKVQFKYNTINYEKLSSTILIWTVTFCLVLLRPSNGRHCWVLCQGLVYSRSNSMEYHLYTFFLLHFCHIWLQPGLIQHNVHSAFLLNFLLRMGHCLLSASFLKVNPISGMSV